MVRDEDDTGGVIAGGRGESSKSGGEHYGLRRTIGNPFYGRCIRGFLARRRAFNERVLFLVIDHDVASVLLVATSGLLL